MSLDIYTAALYGRENEIHIGFARAVCAGGGGTVKRVGLEPFFGQYTLPRREILPELAADEVACPTDRTAITDSASLSAPGPRAEE